MTNVIDPTIYIFQTVIDYVDEISKEIPEFYPLRVVSGEDVPALHTSCHYQIIQIHRYQVELNCASVTCTSEMIHTCL